MDSSATSNSYIAFISSNTKAQTLESTLHKSLDYFKDLLLDFQELYIESENYKSKYVAQKELCERSNCCSAETFKNIIVSKNSIIQSLASILTRLNETKNFSLIDEAFRIICGDPTTNQEDDKIMNTTPQQVSEESKNSVVDNDDDASFKEESLNEIEGTPTGRTSPIIQSKKLRSNTKTLGKSSDCREKTKCPDNWLTSENKTIKLLYRTPTHSKPRGGRLRQSRLIYVKQKQTDVVDLTHSPELSSGIHCSKSDNGGLQTSIKKEHLQNDTILPSPTSESVNFVLKANTINSPMKVTKSTLSLKNKKEKTNKSDLIGNCENEPKCNVTSAEDSINILNRLPKRFPNAFEEPIKIDPIDNDETHCEINLSMSLLNQFKEGDDTVQNKLGSPTKRSLAENMNIVNTPPKKREETRENYTSKAKITVDNAKRCIPELAEPIYKESVVRKKSEKRALPGWCCDECEHFFGELYKDDLEMMAKKIEECSRHRGRQNPIRPKTPPNFWNPRWSVPENTEELNRMNNAI